MKSSEDLVLRRNIGIMAHIDAGKTTTTERILYYTGKTHKIGEVHEGSATMDWMDQEQERGITITSAATSCSWEIDGQEYQYNIIDTPGHVDFTFEVERSLRVLDGAVLVVCGVAGVQPQTENIWRQSEKYQIPKIAFVNKMDRVGASLEKAVESIQERLTKKTVVLQLPIGVEDSFSGVIDLVTMEAVCYDDSSLGASFTKRPLSEEEEVLAAPWRESLLETLSEYNDTILEKLLESLPVTQEEIEGTLREQVISRQILPVVCGSAFKNKGVQELLNAIGKYLPSPLDIPEIQGVDLSKGEAVSITPSSSSPFCSLAFKIASDPFAGQLTFIRVYSGCLKVGDLVYNANKKKNERINQIIRMHANKRQEISELKCGDIGAVIGLRFTTTGETLGAKGQSVVLDETPFPEAVIDMAVEAKTRQDQEKLYKALDSLAKEDPSFEYEVGEETGQTIISGMGELHLEVILERLSRDFNVGCNAGKPRVAYRESINGRAEYSHTFKRVVSNKEHMVTCTLEVMPNEKNKGLVIQNDLVSEANSLVLDAVRQGLEEVSSGGISAGYPLIDVKVVIKEIDDHESDANEVAFKLSAIQAFQGALRNANPVLLEPVMTVEVLVPSQYMGEVISDLNSRRGQVRGIEDQESSQVVRADVPLSEMFGYSTDLRSSTQGRGIYTMQFDHYDPITDEQSKKVMGVG